MAEHNSEATTIDLTFATENSTRSSTSTQIVRQYSEIERRTPKQELGYLKEHMSSQREISTVAELEGVQAIRKVRQLERK